MEAEQFDVPSVIASIYGAEALTSQITSELLMVAYNPEETISAIKIFSERKTKRKLCFVATLSLDDVIDRLLDFAKLTPFDWKERRQADCQY